MKRIYIEYIDGTTEAFVFEDNKWAGYFHHEFCIWEIDDVDGVQHGINTAQVKCMTVEEYNDSGLDSPPGEPVKPI